MTEGIDVIGLPDERIMMMIMTMIMIMIMIIMMIVMMMRMMIMMKIMSSALLSTSTLKKEKINDHTVYVQLSTSRKRPYPLVSWSVS